MHSTGDQNHGAASPALRDDACAMPVSGGVDVLLTGFESFGGAATNPSAAAAEAAARQLRAGGVSALALELPCVFARTRARLAAALREHRPRVVVACGLAGGAQEVRLERVGINLRDARIPDNDGAQPVDEPVRADGPPALFSTLPVKRALQSLDAADVPARLSLSAGSFVCNNVLYELLDLADAAVRAGFVHVPWDEVHAPQDCASLPAAQLAHALVLVAEAALDPAADLDRPGGALH
ncbi:pyroglutamyl-peptidase I [uncultured Micrococcus sp.]|uniref:pyroglutamyl-peptidase I family protein n=1 Tax=uncultured Micrococcus sp. TaxID=114051 RepID=UPI00259617C7|nr:pyroglutamyl-peptidase I [uncultured Micrococcus sp.]